MSELEHKQTESAQSQASPWCVPTAHETQSSTHAPVNPLSAIVPNASVSDEAYQDECYHGPRRDWLSSLMLPPPQDLIDIAIKALNVMSFVGSIAINRGKPPPRIIKTPDNADMLGQAIRHVKSAEGSAAERADAFANMAEQIRKLTGNGWAATRTRSSDGSHVFVGSSGHALVINPQGQLFRGFMYHGGIREVGGGRLELDYGLLRPLH